MAARQWAHLHKKKRKSVTSLKGEEFLIFAFHHTGLRFKDICHLRIEDVDLEAGAIEIIPAKTSRFKKAVYIHLHNDVIDVLKKASENNFSDYFYPEAVGQYGSITNRTC